MKIKFYKFQQILVAADVLSSRFLLISFDFIQYTVVQQVSLHIQKCGIFQPEKNSSNVISIVVKLFGGAEIAQLF